MENDEKLKGLIYDLVISLDEENPEVIKELIRITEINGSSKFILECGLIKYLPFNLLTNFELTISLLISIYSSEESIEIDEFFLDSKNIFFFIEKFYLSIKESIKENIKIIKLFKQIILNLKKQKLILFLNLLYEQGFFILLNCICKEEISDFYDSIFYNKILFKSNQEQTFLTDSKTLIEINRKQFNSEIIFRNKLLIKTKSFKKETIHIKEESNIYNKIAETIDIENLGLNIPIHFFNFINLAFISDDFHDFILKNDITKFSTLRIYLNFYQNLILQSNKHFYFEKYFNPGILITIFQTRKSIHYSLMAINLIYLINEIYKEINFENIDLIKSNKEDSEYLISLLELEEYLIKPCTTTCELTKYKIICIINEMNPNYFLKPSFLILLQALKYQAKNHFCKNQDDFIKMINKLQKNIFLYLKSNPYNFALILFEQKEIKIKKNKINKKEIFDKENEEEINTINSNEEDEEIFTNQNN